MLSIDDEAYQACKHEDNIMEHANLTTLSPRRFMEAHPPYKFKIQHLESYTSHTDLAAI